MRSSVVEMMTVSGRTLREKGEFIHLSRQPVWQPAIAVTFKVRDAFWDSTLPLAAGRLLLLVDDVVSAGCRLTARGGGADTNNFCL